MPESPSSLHIYRIMTVTYIQCGPINTSNFYDYLELRSSWFHFDLVYFENLKRRIKCNLINPFQECLLRNSTSNPYGVFELRSRWFHFDLVYFENLERSIKCKLMFRRRRRRNETAYTSTPDFRSRRDRNETTYRSTPDFLSSR